MINSPPPPILTNEQLQDLRNKIELLPQMAESMGWEPQQVLNMKISMLSWIELIESAMGKEQVPTTNQQEREVVEEDQLTSESESSSSTRRKTAPPHPLTTRISNLPQPEQSLDQLQESMDEDDETKEGRKLLVTSGCTISILDLRLGKNKPIKVFDDIPHLRTIATLDLIEKDLLVLGSLFKLGSNAYMIGGLKFSANDILCFLYNRKDPSNCDMFKAHCTYKPLYDTYCTTYCLSEDSVNRTLLVSDCEIKEMESPKILPVVVEIHGNIHVFDSAPCTSAAPSMDWIFSHEVLKHDHGGGFSWQKIQTIEVVEGENRDCLPNCLLHDHLFEAEYQYCLVDCFIHHHLVVGDCIYATGKSKTFLFDTNKMKWEVRGPIREWEWVDGCDNFKTIWEIINAGEARCVLEIGSAADDQLYVVIALMDYVELGGRRGKSGCIMIALAFLVRSTGEVVCCQFLDHFLRGRFSQLIRYQPG